MQWFGDAMLRQAPSEMLAHADARSDKLREGKQTSWNDFFFASMSAVPAYITVSSAGSNIFDLR